MKLKIFQFVIDYLITRIQIHLVIRLGDSRRFRLRVGNSVADR